jgi:DNA polymerase-3 subunit delta'
VNPLEPFSHIIGNETIKRYLMRLITEKRVPHSLLFTGPSGIGKGLFAYAFAKSLICSQDPDGKQRHKLDQGIHPDIWQYRPEGKLGAHSIDTMRAFSQEVYRPPYEAEWKFFFIHDADRMLSYGANALLKTFEEPAPQSVILLLSSHPEGLLPTVLSRCQRVRFHPIATEQIAILLQKQCHKEEKEAHTLATLACGSVEKALQLVHSNGSDPIRKQLLELLSQGKVATYGELIKQAKSIAEQITERTKESEEGMRKTATKGYPDGLTSIQQQAIDREIEGSLALQEAQEAEAAFDVILSWYRDLHLLSLNGNRSYLLHPDAVNALEQARQRGKILSLEHVQSAIAHTKLSLERSTPLHSCFEDLFLKLEMI